MLITNYRDLKQLSVTSAGIMGTLRLWADLMAMNKINPRLRPRFTHYNVNFVEQGCKSIILGINIIIIIIIMKNFNRCSSHGDQGSKRSELAQHAPSFGLHAFTHTLTWTHLLTTTLYKAPAQLLQNLESIFLIFEGTWGIAAKKRKKRGIISSTLSRVAVTSHTQM